MKDWYRRRDRKQPPPYEERKQSPHKERIVSPPHKRNRREDRNREKSKGPIPQRSAFCGPQDPIAPQASGSNVMSNALQQISQSPFLEEIEKIDLPRRLPWPTFTIYDSKSNPLEHVSHYNQSMAIYSRNEALMCKIFPSSLRPTAMKWFDGLEKGSIQGYNELIKSFEARFVTYSWTPKPFDSFLTMSMK